jgi:hypothetical protein
MTNTRFGSVSVRGAIFANSSRARRRSTSRARVGRDTQCRRVGVQAWSVGQSTVRIFKNEVPAYDCSLRGFRKASRWCVCRAVRGFDQNQDGAARSTISTRVFAAFVARPFQWHDHLPYLVPRVSNPLRINIPEADNNLNKKTARPLHRGLAVCIVDEGVPVAPRPHRIEA